MPPTEGGSGGRMERGEAGAERGGKREDGSRAQSRSFICRGPALPLPGVNYSRAPSAAAAAGLRPAGEERLRPRAGGEITGATPAVAAPGTHQPGNPKRPSQNYTRRVPRSLPPNSCVSPRRHDTPGRCVDTRVFPPTPLPGNTSIFLFPVAPLQI